MSADEGRTLLQVRSLTDACSKVPVGFIWPPQVMHGGRRH
jgi:hypothetical protein